MEGTVMAAFEELKVGSFVRLIKGGVVMRVVEKIEGLREVRCAWHEGRKDRDRVYPPAALDVVPREEAEA